MRSAMQNLLMVEKSPKIKLITEISARPPRPVKYNRPSSFLARGSSAKATGSHRGVPAWVESAE